MGDFCSQVVIAFRGEVHIAFPDLDLGHLCKGV